MNNNQYSQRTIDLPFNLSQSEPGSEKWALFTMAEKLRNGELQKPYFQRDYVWDVEKLISYVETVKTKQAVGVLVTYQIRGGGPVYLADGLQRLTAINKFLLNPVAYGFSNPYEQAKDYCEKFKIDVQHRIYDNHAEAMKAFQDLNKGTHLTPVEFYKGILTGHDLGILIYNTIPNIVSQLEKDYLSGRRKSRTQGLTLIRDSYTLFFQYISKTKRETFWGANSTKLITTKKTIENQLLEYIDKNGISEPDLVQQTKNFERYLASVVDQIRTLRIESNQDKKQFSPTFFRWLLHVAIWKHNVKRSNDLYERFVKRLFDECKQHPNFTTRLGFMDPDTKQMLAPSFNLDSISILRLLCRIFNIPLYEGYKVKRLPGTPGTHNSHKKPVALFGDGETIRETAIRNMSRGAKPIS